MSKKKKDKGNGKILSKDKYINALSAIDIESKVPTGLRPENVEAYKDMIKEICMVEKRFNIKRFAEKWKLTRDTIYSWAKFKETNDIIEAFMDALTVYDKPIVRQIIKQGMLDKPGYASLYLKRYEKWRDDQHFQHNVTINFNLPELIKPPSKSDKEAEEAEFEDI